MRYGRAGAAMAALTTIGAVACSSGALKPPAGAAGSSASIPGVSSAMPSSVPETPLVPSPDGTINGACDYTLGTDPVNGTAVATGDIQAANTGNIGIIIRLTLTWPQQGYAPLRQTKTVRIPDGGNQDVQFRVPLTGNQLDNLQNWQLGHSGESGCTYDGTITGTFGDPS